MKIETRFYPFVLISGRIEWLLTPVPNQTLTSESISISMKPVYIMTKAAFGVKSFISASSSVFLYLRCLSLRTAKVFRLLPVQFAGELSLIAYILSFSTFSNSSTSSA